MAYNAAIVSLLTAVLSFAAVAGLVTIIPGLDTAMVVRSVASYGPKHGFATALGINTGALVWGAGAAVGVSALLTASTVAFDTLRVAARSTWCGWASARCEPPSEATASRRRRPERCLTGCLAPGCAAC